MEIFFSIMTILSLIICVGIIIDKTVFDMQTKNIETGMTGKQIEEVSKCKIYVISISNNNTYYARIQSKMTIFKYRLVFLNGRLISKQKE